MRMRTATHTCTHASNAVALLLLLAPVFSAGAAEIHMKDGKVYTKIRDVRELDAVFLFERDGRVRSVLKQRIRKVTDDDGSLLFEAVSLSVRQELRGDNTKEYVFCRDNKVVGRGVWSGEGVFLVTSGHIPDGLYRGHYDSGKLELEFSMHGGRLSGPCRTYHDTGKLEKQGTFVDGKEHGLSKLFYKSGNLRGQSSFAHGKRDGVTKLYHESGKPRAILRYEAGLATDRTEMFYESGELESEVFFERGRKHGPMRKYFPDGHLKLEAAYERGTLHGTVTTYYESGRVKNIQHFNRGTLLR